MNPSRTNPHRTRRRVGTAVASVASIGVLATSAFGYSAIGTFSGSLQHVEMRAPHQSTNIDMSGPMNFLLVGNDDRSDLSRSERHKLHVGQADYGAHTEPIMIVHVPRDTNPITVVSIPRDSLVTIPASQSADGTRTEARQGKVNSAYGQGGPELVIRTIEQATGVPINHYVEVGLGGFVNLVNEVGGIPMCLNAALRDQDAGLDLPAGEQRLDGRNALALVRARHIDNDLGRIGRQQQLLMALGKQTLESGRLLNPLAINDLLKIVASSIKTDSGLGSDQLVALATRLANVDPDKVKMTTVPVADANLLVDGQGSTVMWDRTKSDAVFAPMRAGQEALPGVPAPNPVPAAPVDPSSVLVRVVNASGIRGMGTRAAAELRRWNFRTGGILVDKDLASSTEILYPPDLLDQAKTLAAAVPGSTLREDPSVSWAITLRVGPTFAGTGSIAVPDRDAGPDKDAGSNSAPDRLQTPDPKVSAPKTGTACG